MGIENYLLASCLKGVLAQRLVRKLCQSCATLVDDHEASAATIPKAFGSDTSMPRSPLYLRKAVGCPVCRQSGFSGRTTIYELLTMTPQLQDAMLSGQSETKILKFASKGGMVPMLENGLAKVFAGETIPEEVYRVTQQDRCPISPTEPTISAES